jgi:hypothetical protein
MPHQRIRPHSGLCTKCLRGRTQCGERLDSQSSDISSSNLDYPTKKFMKQKIKFRVVLDSFGMVMIAPEDHTPHSWKKAEDWNFNTGMTHYPVVGWLPLENNETRTFQLTRFSN